MIRSVDIRLEDVDWTELREQKKVLFEIMETGRLTDRQSDRLEGLLNFLDHIQDQAVGSGQMEAKDVYILDNDPWHEEGPAAGAKAVS